MSNSIAWVRYKHMLPAKAPMLCSLRPYLPIRTFSTGQTVALRWAEQRNGVDLDQYPSLQRSRAAGHP